MATPLGNLRDLTFRARDILATADVVAAEDSRVTATLLARHGIAKRPTPLHEHNEARRAQDVVGWLAAGRSVALVSDAGTPAISDPGARLVAAVAAAGHRVVPVPGPCALVAALSAAGIAADAFVFAGFLPAQPKARRDRLAALAALPFAVVLYEAPHRVRQTVEDCAALAAGRELVIARELTKTFESIARLPVAEGPAWLDADPHRTRGEFVLILDAPPASAHDAALTPDIERWLAALLAELPPARAARVVAAVSGVDRAAVYERALVLKAGAAGGRD